MSLTGTVKLFNPLKGFGFITAADGSDVFLHIKACADEGIPKTGDKVQYDSVESPVKPGQFQAGNVTGGTGVAAEKGAGKGGVVGTGSMQGQCKSFNVEKGFGFVIGADGSDIFFHARGMVDGTTPQAGDQLLFDLQPSKMKPDQMQAENITGGTGWGKGDGKGGGKGGYGAAKGGWGGGDSWGGDSWGASPYGGGKGEDGGKGGKGGKMAALMSMMSGMMGGKGGDSWGGGKGGDSWGGKGGW